MPIRMPLKLTRSMPALSKVNANPRLVAVKLEMSSTMRWSGLSITEPVWMW